MSKISLRNKLNREAVEEDLRANKEVYEREIKQVNLMGQQMVPATTDELVLKDTIDKFVNVLLVKLEELNIIASGINEQKSHRLETRKSLNIGTMLIDWNMIAKAYINPSNTEKQRNTVIQTILKLENPLRNLIETITIQLQYLFEEDPTDESVEVARLLIKVLAFCKIVGLKLDTQNIRPIQKGDLESEFLSIIKTTPYARILGIDKLEKLYYGRNLEPLHRQEFQQELSDIDEEDAEDLRLDILNEDENQAMGYDYGFPIQIRNQGQAEPGRGLPDIFGGLFGYGMNKGKEDKRRNRIKHIASPLDYNYEKNDVYADYRLE